MKKMKEYCRILSIATIAAAGLTAFWALWTAFIDIPLLGMQREAGVLYPVGLIGLGGTAACFLVQGLFGFQTLKNTKKGQTCNTLSYGVLFLFLLVVLWMLGDSWQRWLLYIVLEAPSLLLGEAAKRIAIGDV